MSKFRYLEIFYSVQGEGIHCGVPSVFLRMFGCNFKCQGFGMPRGELSDEYLKVDIKKYDNIKDAPLVVTGCDSYASWDNRAKHLTRDVQVDELVEELLAVTPNGRWKEPNGQDIHLVITGGEPLLGWQRLWPDLLSHPKMEDLKQILRNYLEITSLLISDLKTDLRSLGLAVQNFPCRESLGVMQSGLKLLWATIMLPIVLCISSLWSLMKLIYEKLMTLCQNSDNKVLKYLYTVCLSADVKMSMWRIDRKLRKSQCKKDTDTHLDYT